MFENTLASLVLKKLQSIQNTLASLSVEKVACSLYIDWQPPIKNSGQCNQ